MFPWRLKSEAERALAMDVYAVSDATFTRSCSCFPIFFCMFDGQQAIELSESRLGLHEDYKIDPMTGQSGSWETLFGLQATTPRDSNLAHVFKTA